MLHSLGDTVVILLTCLKATFSLKEGILFQKTVCTFDDRYVASSNHLCMRSPSQYPIKSYYTKVASLAVIRYHFQVVTYNLVVMPAVTV